MLYYASKQPFRKQPFLEGEFALITKLQDIVKRNYDAFSGFALESYFRAKFVKGLSLADM